MTAKKRYFYQGSDYHIYNRGNHREHLFRDNDDRRYFLSKLDQYAARDKVAILAYCLMDNHFHLLLRQCGDTPVARTIRSLTTGYARRTNFKYGLVGHLFQGRYSARFIRDQTQLVFASRYIHRNPASFTDIRTYRWSSYRQYVEQRAGIADPAAILEAFESIDSYTMFVENALSSELMQAKPTRR